MIGLGRRAGEKLFGTVRRTQILVALALLEESYPREMARLLDAPLITVQRVVDALEHEGIVATRLIGKERRVTLDPRFYADREMRVLLHRIAETDPALGAMISRLRKRPRKRGKPL